MKGRGSAGISCYKIFLRDLLSSHVKMKTYVTSHCGMLGTCGPCLTRICPATKESLPKTHDILFKLKRADARRTKADRHTDSISIPVNAEKSINRQNNWCYSPTRICIWHSLCVVTLPGLWQGVSACVCACTPQGWDGQCKCRLSTSLGWSLSGRSFHQHRKPDSQKSQPGCTKNQRGKASVIPPSRTQLYYFEVKTICILIEARKDKMAG